MGKIKHICLFFIFKPSLKDSIRSCEDIEGHIFFGIMPLAEREKILG